MMRARWADGQSVWWRPSNLLFVTVFLSLLASFLLLPALAGIDWPVPVPLLNAIRIGLLESLDAHVFLAFPQGIVRESRFLVLPPVNDLGGYVHLFLENLFQPLS